MELSAVDPMSPAARWAMQQYFAELDARFDGGFDPGDALDAAADYVAPTGAFVLARDDDGVAGCGAVVRVDDDRAEIKRMWVAPSARGRGLGRRLLLRLEDEARALGATTAILDTNGVLTEAIAMYEHAGYHGVERYNDNPYAQRWFAKSLRRLPATIDAGDGMVLVRWSSALAHELATAFEASEPELRRWMPYASAEQEDAPAFVVAADRAFDAGQTFAYAVTVDGGVVGYCNLTPEGDDGAEVGYWVRTDRTGAGIGTRAIDALVLAATTALPALAWVDADVHADNVASRRLLAKCGFEGDGPTLRRHVARSIGEQGDQGRA
jgi:RimJ/RimL family protein N-acetyltransferase